MDVHCDVATGTVVQFGNGLGQRAGCTLYVIDDPTSEAALMSLLAQVAGDGAVLRADDGTFTLRPPSPDYLAAQAAWAALAAADAALLTERAAVDPAFAALARTLGVLT